METTRKLEDQLLNTFANKEIGGLLISIRSDVPEHEHVEIILEGMSNEYDAFSTAL